MTDLISPPPYRGTKAEVADLEEMSGDASSIAQLWDHIALHGPLTRDDVLKASPIQHSGVWREYERWHPNVTVKDYDRLNAQATHWYHNHLMDRFLRRGWATDIDGLIHVGTIPEIVTPLASVGGEDGALRALLAGQDEVVRKVLTQKSNPSRLRPDRAAVDALRTSLQQDGQWDTDPIIVWEGDARRGWPRVVVDGQTRLELMTELGIEPKFTYLPATMSPVEVLMRRIRHEVARKRLSEDDRRQYIETLVEAGVPMDDVADQLAVSRRTVERVTNATRVANDTDQAQEWAGLRDQGWALRAIADEYGVSHMTVKRRLEWLAEQQAEPPKEPTREERLKEVGVQAGLGSGSKVYDVAKNSRAVAVAIEYDDALAEAARAALLRRQAQEPKPGHVHRWICADCGQAME